MWQAIKRFWAKTQDLYNLRSDVEHLKTDSMRIYTMIHRHENMLQFLMEHEPRTVRRKWARMITNPRSPFFIGHQDIDKVLKDSLIVRDEELVQGFANRGV